VRAAAWWVLWFSLVVVRLLLLSAMLQGGVVSMGFAVLEWVALVFGVWNGLAAQERFCSNAGLFPPMAYLYGVILLMPLRDRPCGLAGAALLVAGLVLQTWALCCLRSRFSIGPSSFVALCDWGPYAYVRHPQFAARLLILAAMASTCRGPEVCFVLVSALLAWAVVRCEEAALSGVATYRDYRSRVRWVAVPGLL
jgi:protein-S-isoprenylcysteine O-methyltransferase Ste14